MKESSSKKNVFNIITIIIAVISLFISILALREQQLDSKVDYMPRVTLSDKKIEFKTQGSFKPITYLENIALQTDGIIASNIGNGIALNIHAVWDKTNLHPIIKQIKKLDKKNLFNIEDKNEYYEVRVYGNIVKVYEYTIYTGVDYITPLKEKGEDSTKDIEFPSEYKFLLSILLMVQEEYKVYDMGALTLEFDLTFKDIRGNKYTDDYSLVISYSTYPQDTMNTNLILYKSEAL